MRYARIDQQWKSAERRKQRDGHNRHWRVVNIALQKNWETGQT
jgi:hypothetical protein